MKKHNLKVVLIEPEIPQNTGNIVRLCACAGAELYLVGKLGFSLAEKHLKRAGLDYWDSAKIIKVNTFEELQEKYSDSNFYFLTTKYDKKYTDVSFKEDDFIVFGPESRGIAEDLLAENSKTCLTIPMLEGQRSLNLSNSVSIVLYEAIRQISL